MLEEFHLKVKSSLRKKWSIPNRDGNNTIVVILLPQVQRFIILEQTPVTCNDNYEDGDVVNTEGDTNFFVKITAEELQVDMEKCNNVDVVNSEDDMKFDVTIKTGDL